jgi:Arc/MetJ-type ribon-helix-helix transcriptional regulator
MAYLLTKENKTFIERMVKLRRFNNQGEVVREACGGWNAMKPITSILLL